MPKWSKEAREFVVSVNCHRVRGCNCQVPKPIMELLGNPKKVRYVIISKGKGKVEFESAD